MKRKRLFFNKETAEELYPFSGLHQNYNNNKSKYSDTIVNTPIDLDMNLENSFENNRINSNNDNPNV